MGLLDILNGMQSGPSGQRQPQSGGGGDGMSPLTMALLGLLAVKAVKSFTGGQGAAPGGGQPLPSGGTAAAGSSGGGLGDILGGLLGGQQGGAAAGAGGGGLNDLIQGGLGGLLGGAGAGSVLAGGLNELIKGLQNSGHGNEAQSWVGNGPNQEIAPKDLASALGGDTINELAEKTGMGRDDLLAGLSQNLPKLVDTLTPNGRLPTAEEASQMV